MSTWSFEGPGLVGCGIDAERVSRFETLSTRDGWPWPDVFSAAEIEHCEGLDRPARGYCASFCVKEAVVKALGEAFDMADCLTRWVPGEEAQVVDLSPGLRRRRGIGNSEAAVRIEGDECIAVVWLMRSA